MTNAWSSLVSRGGLSGLVTRGSPYLVCSLGRHLIWFGYLGDALSGLVTRETPGLVSITREAWV